MSGPLKWILLLTVVTIRAQDPRRRNFLLCPDNGDIQPTKLENEKSDCLDGKCISKRFESDEMGPFWANRGKKNPVYMREPLYVEEPYWLMVRRDNELQEDPFFLSRGKKESSEIFSSKLRDTRNYVQNRDAPFFAARGKRLQIKD